MDINKVSSMINELFQPMLDYRNQLIKIEDIKHKIRKSEDLKDSDFIHSLLDLELKVNEDSRDILAKILEQKALDFAAKIKEMERNK